PSDAVVKFFFAEQRFHSGNPIEANPNHDGTTGATKAKKRIYRTSAQPLDANASTLQQNTRYAGIHERRQRPSEHCPQPEASEVAAAVWSDSADAAQLDADRTEVCEPAQS